MDSASTRPSPPPGPTMPSSDIAPTPQPDAPRRCFICLTDEDPSDPPSSWVDPCPCTLEAHQDCMLSWVTDCERSNKPLQCPVCKSKIELEGPWEPIVAASESIARHFTRASPWILAASAAVGVQVSLQTYGAMAMLAFSGHEALMKFIFGPDMGINGGDLKHFRPSTSALGSSLVLTGVAPALLLGQLMPWMSNKILTPSAFVFGIYHVMRDDDFLSWPPSPKLVMAVFPYVRTTYLNLWREFVFPHEVNLNRRIMGLPPIEQQEEAQANNQREGAQEANAGGLLGFIQGMIDVLEGEDEQEQAERNPQGGVRFAHGIDGEDGGMVVELVIEEVEVQDGDADDSDDEFVRFDENLRQRMEARNQQRPDQQPAPEPAQRPADEQAIPAPAPAPADQPAAHQNHEAPQAPVRRPTLGGILSSVSNAIVSCLILPGMSCLMGELIRLVLPKAWTSPSAKFGRPGLLQQQWGRSLVGGCLYVVMKDAVRFYTKYRTVASMGNRRVKNVQSRRNRK